MECAAPKASGTPRAIARAAKRSQEGALRRVGIPTLRHNRKTASLRSATVGIPLRSSPKGPLGGVRGAPTSPRTPRGAQLGET